MNYDYKVINKQIECKKLIKATFNVRAVRYFVFIPRTRTNEQTSVSPEQTNRRPFHSNKRTDVRFVSSLEHCEVQYKFPVF